MILRRLALILSFAAAGWSRAAAGPSNLANALPRSMALGGADLAVTAGSPLPTGSVADLGRLDGASLLVGGGIATPDGGNALRAGAGGVVEGFGVAASVARREGSGTRWMDYVLGVGLPVPLAEGLALGVGVHAITESAGGDSAAGFALEAGAAGHFGLGAPGFEGAVGAGIENGLGVLTWRSGLKEDLPLRARFGVAVRKGPFEVVMGEYEVRGPGYSVGVYSSGVEYSSSLSSVPFAVRAGYRGRPAVYSFGVGVGREPVLLDYAVAAVSGGGVLHSLSVEWRFAGAGRGSAGGPRVPARAGKPARDKRLEAEVAPERDVFTLDTPYRTLSLALRVPADEVTRGWTVLIVAEDGTVVWETSGEGVPPRAVTWNGASLAGEPVPAGTYGCRLLLRGATAPDSLSAGASIRVMRPGPKPEAPAGPEGGL